VVRCHSCGVDKGGPLSLARGMTPHRTNSAFRSSVIEEYAMGALDGASGQCTWTESKFNPVVEEGLKMESCKNDVADVSQTSMSLVNGENRRKPVHRRSTGLASRVREIDCMLADIQAEIGMLQRERTHLGLVRGELAGVKAK